jgi:hypothetical protein
LCALNLISTFLLHFNFSHLFCFFVLILI